MGAYDRLLRQLVARRGLQLVPDEIVAQMRRIGGGAPRAGEQPLPPGAAEYLREDNSRLRELRRRYAAHPVGANRSLWNADYVDAGVDLQRFRADSAFRWQTRANAVHDEVDGLIKIPMREINYAITAHYVRSVDRLGLLDLLHDDGQFGNCVVDVDGFSASTDAMDSALQIDFIDRHIGLDALRGKSVLDIGAGYGRFAHRVAQAVPGVQQVLCTDAVAESTFVCEYYLRFRGVDACTRVVALDEIEDSVEPGDVTLAVNMHSFPEMPLASIRWWLDLLVRNRVPYLMVVPNAFNRTACEPDGTTPPFGPSIAAAGYELIAEEPKYRLPSLQTHGLYPGEHLLYALRDAAA